MRHGALTVLLLAVACGPALPAVDGFAVFASGVPGPRAVAATQGRVHVLDGTGRLLVFDAAGNAVITRELVKTARGFPAGITVAGDGRLFIADTHESRVRILSPEGEEVGSFGRYGSGPGEFVYPQRIAFLDDEVFVTEFGFDENNRVQVFGPDGSFRRAFGGFGTAGFSFKRPCGIAALPGGSLCVADASHRILRISPAGEHLGDLGKPGRDTGGLDYPYGLAAGPEHLYVCEYGTNRISRFRHDGTFAGCWAPPAGDPRALLHPRDLSLDGARLLVADTGNDRVVRLSPDVLDWQGIP
jgi:DNA-binding beta-propeller fold protein YncE